MLFAYSRIGADRFRREAVHFAKLAVTVESHDLSIPPNGVFNTIFRPRPESLSSNTIKAKWETHRSSLGAHFIAVLQGI